MLQEFVNVLTDFVESTVVIQFVKKTVAIVENVFWQTLKYMGNLQHLVVLKHPVNVMKVLKEMHAILDVAPMIVTILTLRFVENANVGSANVSRNMQETIARYVLESANQLEAPYRPKVLSQRSTITDMSKIKWLNNQEVFYCLTILTFCGV